MTPRLRQRVRASILVVMLSGGCLVGLGASQETAHRIWNDWMVAGHYGYWYDGGERPWPIPRRERIVSYPLAATDTAYGIKVHDVRSLVGVGWILSGGLIARAVTPHVSIELFGKEITRVKLPAYVSRRDQDYSYDFSLLVRPRPSEAARVVAQWHVEPNELAMTIDPRVKDLIERSSRSDKEKERDIERNMHHHVEGHLQFDPVSQVATVTVTGLTHPFEQRVDLSNALAQ